MNSATQTNGWTWMKPAIWGFYLVVGLEFLFMISPFALHFYSAYGEPLRWLTASPVTAWLTWFFLPHYSQTASPILSVVKPLGFLLAELGLLLFLIGVVQIYGSKLLRRGAVTGGLYRVVRHPQYFALSVLGMGVTLIWPRFLVLLSFVSMLFVYYILAAWEEKLCLERYGESYRQYQQRTGRIFPRIFRISRSDGSDNGFRWRRGLAIYAVTVSVVLILAFAARAISLDAIAARFGENVVVLSPALLADVELDSAYRLALTDPQAAGIVEREQQLLVYVVPVEWFLPDLPLHTEAEIRRVGGGHHTAAFSDRKYKLLFCRPRLHSDGATGREIVARAHGQEPLGLVRVDLDSGQILGWDEIPDHVIWGDIPTPLF